MRTLDSGKKEIEKSYYVKMLETFSSQMTIFIGFNNCYIVLPLFTNPHKGKNKGKKKW